jgi:hypothetical protein
MSTKEQAQRNEKIKAKRRPPQPGKPVEPLGQQIYPTTIIQQTRLAPRSLTPRDAQQLQQMIGNQTVSKLLTRTEPRPVVQPKWVVGPVGDQYEQEADRVAKQVLSIPSQPSEVQRQEKEEQGQTISAGSTGTHNWEISSGLEQSIQNARGGRQAPDDGTRRPMQRHFADFSGVHVHTDSQSDRLNRSVSTEALKITATPATQFVVQRIPESVKRQLRIWKRQIDKKSLPNKVYRIDARDANTIKAQGFQPWKATGNISIKEHVTGALDQALADGSTLAKYQSQFVSTAAYHGLADAVLAQVSQGKYLYKIDTTYAGLNPADFNDVNDYFDKRGIPRPYPKQREWLKQGGIPGAAVTHYMGAQGFFLQANVVGEKLVLPNEGNIAGWQSMP